MIAQTASDTTTQEMLCPPTDVFNRYEHGGKGSTTSQEKEDIGELANTRAFVR